MAGLGKLSALLQAGDWPEAERFFTTVAELADREGIAPSYMTRVLRLTLLAPDIVKAILDGRQVPVATLARVFAPFPLKWETQEQPLAVATGTGHS